MKQFHLFVKVAKNTIDAMKFLLFMLLIIILVFSSIIYLVEPRENIDKLPTAMWLTIVTMTTVGYGDITPCTSQGHCVMAVLMLSSVLYMAMPIGILGNAVTQVWKDRDYILLVSRTHEWLVQWGYTTQDIPHLFKHFDGSGDGQLSLQEFREMIRDMRIGIHEDRIVKLFEEIDKDGGGTIEFKEFIKALFPNAYHELCANKPKRKVRRRLTSSWSSNPAGAVQDLEDAPECK